MPMLIPVVAGAAAAGYIGGLAIAGAGIWGAVAGAVVATGVGKVMGLGKQPQPNPTTFNNVQNGALINGISTVDPIPIVYGTRQVGGTRILREASGASNEFLHCVYVLSEGEIEAIDTVYLDNVASDNARFSGLVTIEKYLGTDDQAASSALIAALDEGSPSPGLWTTDHRGRGVAYIYVKLQYNQDAFYGLPTVTADVRGKKVWDPRVAGSPSTIAHSDNPALCILDYLINTRYGRGVPVADVDIESFTAAADYCDQLVSVPAVGSPSFTQQKRYTCNGIVIPDSGTMENMRSLLTSCRGSLVRSGEKYKLVLDKPTDVAEDFEFNADNIVGEWGIRPAGKRDKLNRVRARIFNPDRNWQPDFALVDSPAFRTEDNGLLLERTIELPFTADLYMAQQIGQIELKQARIGTVCSFTAQQAGQRCEVGDVVPITHDTPAWDAKPFRILAVELLNDHLARITAREYDETVYDLDSLTLTRTTAPSNLPSIFSVAPPTGLTFAQSTTLPDRGELSWTAAADAFVDRYQPEYKRSADSEWIVLPATRDTFLVLPKLDPGAYDFRVKAINAGGVASSYATTQGDLISARATSNYLGGADFLGVVNLVATIGVGDFLGASTHGMFFCPRNNKMYAFGFAEAIMWQPDPVNLSPTPEGILTTERCRAGCYIPTLGYIAITSDAGGSPSPDRLLIVDPIDNSVVARYNPWPSGGSANLVWFNPGDGYLWVGVIFSGGFSWIYVVNPATGALVTSIELTFPNTLTAIAYCPTNHTVYAGINTSAVRPIPLSGSPAYYLGAAITLPNTCTGVAYVSSTDEIVASTLSGISFITVATSAVAASITAANAYDVIYVPENDRIYAGNSSGTDQIYMVAPSTRNMRTATFTVGGQIIDLAFCPLNNKLYVGGSLPSLSVCTV